MIKITKKLPNLLRSKDELRVCVRYGRGGGGGGGSFLSIDTDEAGRLVGPDAAEHLFYTDKNNISKFKS